ncbi:MAG: site-specific integrase [Candidatus Omnitrophica bacterium]|nr:site-specific integrase [Candidatus Omnitrophota bacterium]
MKRYSGVRLIERGVYEINYRPYKKASRVFKRVKADSLQEADQVRAEAKAAASRQFQISSDGKSRLHAGLSEIWDSIDKSLQSENRPRRTILRYRKTFFRLFSEFKDKKFPNMQEASRISLTFLEEYKSYYCVDLGMQGGWRAELIVVKAIIGRMYRLGYCEEAAVNLRKLLQAPKAIKKSFPDIPVSKIKELLSFIKSDRPDYYPLMYFIVRTGRRIEESTLIERRDVVWNGIRPMQINIRAETTKMRENAPLKSLDAELEDVVRQAYKSSMRHKAPWLFLNKHGKKCSQTRVRNYLKESSLNIIGVEITPHYFRHRFFTECGKNNLPLIDVMEISGLKDVKIMNKYYSHGTVEGRANVLEKTGF